ncbi:MAG TPA: glycosyltransferase [Thermoanaerobaculia bacterium]|nr:glycosyltransferase [Thermoanaerobaculia bacterium]
MKRRPDPSPREVTAWVGELVAARRWLADQIVAWTAASARDARRVAEQRTALDGLERSIEWHEKEIARAHAALAASSSPADERPRGSVAGAAALAPAVSIVTPFFDAGARFALTAASVLAQSLTRWEWIIVNDGSTDPDSLRELERVSAMDDRIRVLDHRENRGVGAARNTGFAAARAPYVLQIDADDQLEPTAAEKWLWYLHTHPEAGFVNGHTICHGAIEGIWTQGFEQAEKFLERNFVGGRGMVRRSVHEAAGGYDPAMPLALEDWDFWLRCADAGHWGVTLDEAFDWQHRRGTDAEQWPDWDGGERQAAARASILARYPRLVANGMPRIARGWPQPYEPVSFEAPCANSLARSRPRLLLVVAWMALGGTDRFNLDLIDVLTERGWDVTVATTLRSADEWRAEYRRRTPDVFMLHRFLEPNAYPAFLRYLIESRHPRAVVVSHSELGYQLLPTLRASCPEAAFIDYLHILEPNWKSGGYPRMSTLFHRQLDLTLVLSESLRSWMIEQGAEPERIELLRTAVDSDLFRPDPVRRRAVRARLGIDERRLTVLFAGRLCEQKRPLVVARTFERLRARGVEFTALVAGEGELREQLERYLSEHDLGREVRLLGALPSDEMAATMAASDLFFLPSEREGIALSLIEAMATGLAVVATDVGGQRELVTDGTGVLLPMGEDAATIERYAEELERLGRARELREAMGRAARARVVDEWSPATLGQRFEAAVERARELAAAAPRPALDRVFAERTAELAVEFMRLNELCDALWLERVARERLAAPAAAAVRSPELSAPAAAAAASPGARRGAGAVLFGLLKRMSEPLYVWGIRNGWSWLLPLKERVKSRMLARS